MKKTGLPLQYSFWKRPLILAMKSATHSENNRGASIPSLFSVLIYEYLGLGSSTSPTWDRTRFQQTRGGETSGKRMNLILINIQEKHNGYAPRERGRDAKYS